MIICCPNSAPYEIFAYSDKWIEYYLDIGVSVFLWNYRGFGESKGSLSFENLREDAECVADFLRKFYKFNKIGVHGISIGGIPASHLAAYASLLIIEKT
jgi:alpha/beta superfamily hydrolase